MDKNSTCSVDGCERTEKTARMNMGMCVAHYTRTLKYGNPLHGGPVRPRARNGAPLEWIRGVAVPYDLQGPCLMWPFGNGDGRGAVAYNGRKVTPHRLVCVLRHGEQPTSHRNEVAHACGRGHDGCCNPMHMYWATTSENERDKLQHGTHNRGAQHPLSKLTAADVLSIRAACESGGHTRKELAATYGISPRYVSDLVNRRSWAHLK